MIYVYPKERTLSHEPIMLLLRGTESTAHRLVLVMGREANNAGTLVDEVGFIEPIRITSGSKDHCRFWDMAYSLAAAGSDTSASALKGQCLKRGCSPIAFADASPIPLDGSASSARKKRIRASIPVETLERHAESVLSLDKAVGRIGLVILSGLHGSGLDHGVPALERAIAARDIPFRHVTSLNSSASGHSQKRRLVELGDHARTLREILGEHGRLPTGRDGRRSAA